MDYDRLMRDARRASKFAEKFQMPAATAATLDKIAREIQFSPALVAAREGAATRALEAWVDAPAVREISAQADAIARSVEPLIRLIDAKSTSLDRWRASMDEVGRQTATGLGLDAETLAEAAQQGSATIGPIVEPPEISDELFDAWVSANLDLEAESGFVRTADEISAMVESLEADLRTQITGDIEWAEIGISPMAFFIFLVIFGTSLMVMLRLKYPVLAEVMDEAQFAWVFAAYWAGKIRGSGEQD